MKKLKINIEYMNNTKHEKSLQKHEFLKAIFINLLVTLVVTFIIYLFKIFLGL